MGTWEVQYVVRYAVCPVRTPWAMATMACMPFVVAEIWWRDGVRGEGWQDEGREDVGVRVL